MATAPAQQADRVDRSFGASLGLLRNLFGLAVQPDGKLLVYGGLRGGVARFNVDGTLDIRTPEGDADYERGFYAPAGAGLGGGKTHGWRVG